MKSTAYEQAGVSLDAADEVVDKVKPLAQRTFRPGVIGGLGGFGGLFHLDPNKWKNPVLVSGTDGVGTKLKLAFDHLLEFGLTVLMQITSCLLQN